MEEIFKRPKEIPSETEQIPLAMGCGNLHFTLGRLEEEGRPIEVRCSIGRCGTCGNVLLDTIAKLLSVILQSGMPKYKIEKKLRKLFMPDTKGNRINCGQGLMAKSCVEEIIERVLKEINK